MRSDLFCVIFAREGRVNLVVASLRIGRFEAELLRGLLHHEKSKACSGMVINLAVRPVLVLLIDTGWRDFA